MQKEHLQDLETTINGKCSKKKSETFAYIIKCRIFATE